MHARQRTPYIERAIFSAALPPLMLHGQCLRRVTKNLLLDVYGKATALLSNVPGPQSQVEGERYERQE